VSENKPGFKKSKIGPRKTGFLRTEIKKRFSLLKNPIKTGFIQKTSKKNGLTNQSWRQCAKRLHAKQCDFCGFFFTFLPFSTTQKLTHKFGNQKSTSRM
jgi:hypothetical protein